jgi:energy-coupling factor transporter ATP-binding protein EcfA2
MDSDDNPKIILDTLKVTGLLKLGSEDKPFTIKFNDGLNILVGPNRCGKTRVLAILAHLLSYPKKDIEVFRSYENGSAILDMRVNSFMLENLLLVEIANIAKSENVASQKDYKECTFMQIKDEIKQYVIDLKYGLCHKDRLFAVQVTIHECNPVCRVYRKYDNTNITLRELLEESKWTFYPCEEHIAKIYEYAKDNQMFTLDNAEHWNYLNPRIELDNGRVWFPPHKEQKLKKPRGDKRQRQFKKIAMRNNTFNTKSIAESASRKIKEITSKNTSDTRLVYQQDREVNPIDPEKDTKFLQEVADILGVTEVVHNYSYDPSYAICDNKEGREYNVNQFELTYGQKEVLVTWIKAKKICQGVLLMDEPFTHCHPTLARKILTKIQNLKMQIIMTTHLVHMIRDDATDGVQMFYENGFLNLRKLLRDKDTADGSKLAIRQTRQLIIGISQLGFAKSSLLVEGSMDELIYSLLIESTDADRGITSCRGKSNVPLVHKIVSEFRENIKVILDCDVWIEIIKDIEPLSSFIQKIVKIPEFSESQKDSIKDMKGDENDNGKERANLIDKCLADNQPKFREMLMNKNIYIISTEYRDLEGMINLFPSVQDNKTSNSKYAVLLSYYDSKHEKIMAEMKDQSNTPGNPWNELKRFLNW